MRRFGLCTLLVTVVGCGDSGVDDTLPPVNAGVNVLLITIDTLRADHLSSYGYVRQTSPNIDALAATGVIFDGAHTYWPKTRGSFAAMFTGLYASQHGLTVRDRDLPGFNQTLAETFADAGYETAAALDNGNLDEALGFAQGFETYEQTWLSGDTELERTEAITRFGETFLARDASGQPFFLWLHYVNPHTPYEPPEETLSMFRGDGLVPEGPVLERVTGYHGGVNRKHVAVDGEEHWGDYIDRYDAEIRVADTHIGRVIQALEAGGRRDSTLVVLTSDHGESLGEHNYYFDHGNDLFNPSLRIPFVLSFPGMLPTGLRVAGAVSTLDLYPTILDLSRLSYPPELQGKSVLPLVRGTTDELHDNLFFQNDQHQMAISNGRLKLIHDPQGDVFSLFDTYRDPAERENRYAGAAAGVAPFKAQLSSFRTRTIAWQQVTSSKREDAGADAVQDSDLPDKTRERLCSLGYIDCGEEDP